MGRSMILIIIPSSLLVVVFVVNFIPIETQSACNVATEKAFHLDMNFL